MQLGDYSPVQGCWAESSPKPSRTGLLQRVTHSFFLHENIKIGVALKKKNRSEYFYLKYLSRNRKVQLGFSGLHLNICGDCDCARAELADSSPGHSWWGEAAQGHPLILPAAQPLAGSCAWSSCFLGPNRTCRKMFVIGKKMLLQSWLCWS